MKVAGVHLSNITCFEYLSLDFTHEDAGEPTKWVIILGENGTGKSTLLQMIGATLLHEPLLAVVAWNMDIKSYIRNGSDGTAKAECSLVLRPEPGDFGYETSTPNRGFDPQTSDRTAVLFLPSKHVYDPGVSSLLLHPASIINISTGPVRKRDHALEHQFSDSITGGWFICGYGTSRRITGQSVSDRGPIPTLDDSAKPYRFASLFGDASGMTNVPDWLARLYFQAIYPGHSESDEKRFETARAAILRALPHLSALEVTQESRVIVTEGKTRVPLERLSEGYRGTLAWVGDLIRRLFDAYPNSPDPLKERGVVLVDEIDLHLHPQWQRSVVEDIRKLFPNLQFIATTHSPFVVQDMRPQDRIVVLERSGRGKGGPVIAREEPGALQDWTADQILAAYFGLPRGTRGEAAQRDEARYERLLDIQAKRPLTDAELSEFEKLRARIDRIPIGATPDEQAFDRVADNVIAGLRQRHQELAALRRGSPISEEASNGGSTD